MKKLDVKSFTLAFGISVSAYMLLLGITSYFGWGTELVELISSLYIGFKPGIVGALIGAVWGFVDGAVGGLLIALFYNVFTKK